MVKSSLFNNFHKKGGEVFESPIHNNVLVGNNLRLASLQEVANFVQCSNFSRISSDNIEKKITGK